MPSQTFTPTAMFEELQLFAVPAYVYWLKVDLAGAQAAGAIGKGERVRCNLAVTPLEALYTHAGAHGHSHFGTAGGFSAVFQGGLALADRRVVGGGGGDGPGGGNAGNVSGVAGDDGDNASGGSSGGSANGGAAGIGAGGGSDGDPGTLGYGGKGGAGAAPGGDGGDGWYGGGGGGGDADGGAIPASGGGGSSHAGTNTSSPVFNAGHTGDGYVALTWATVEASGSFIFSVMTERLIRGGGAKLTLALVDATWDTAIGSNSSVTTALLDALVSNKAEAKGWTTLVRPALTYENMTRETDTVVSIVFPSVVDYDISEDETISLTIPASCTSFGLSIGVDLAA